MEDKFGDNSLKNKLFNAVLRSNYQKYFRNIPWKISIVDFFPMNQFHATGLFLYIPLKTLERHLFSVEKDQYYEIG